MDEIVRSSFLAAMEQLAEEVKYTPMSECNEAVFRQFFNRSVATTHGEVSRFVECGKIDLVLSRGRQRAFIEFKFYRFARKYDPYGKKSGGFKGGPSKKNLEEFQGCVDTLHHLKTTPGLSKYIVLVYSDPTRVGRRRLSFSQFYDDYKHVRAKVKISEIARSKDLDHREGVVKGRLYKIGAR